MSEFIYEKITKNQPIRICEVTAANHVDGDGAFFAQVIFRRDSDHMMIWNLECDT